MDIGYKGRPVVGASVEQIGDIVRVGMIEGGESNTEWVFDLSPDAADKLRRLLAEVTGSSSAR